MEITLPHFFYKKYNKFFTPQLTNTDCGLAALGMILKYYNNNTSIINLFDKALMDENGISISNIKFIAEKLGLKVKVMKANESIFSKRNIPYPYIIHVANENTNHYDVVFESDKKFSIIGDPNSKIGVTKVRNTELLQIWTGIAIFFEPTAIFIENDLKKFSYRLFMIKQKKIIFTIICLSLLISMISVGGSFAIQYLIDSLVSPHKGDNHLILNASIIVLILFYPIIIYFRQYIVTVFGQMLSQEIVNDYVKNLMKIPFSIIESLKIGELISRFNDSFKITEAVGSLIVFSIVDLTMAIIISGYLISKLPQFIFVLIFLIVFYGLVIFQNSKRLDESNLKNLTAMASLNTDLIDAFRGITDIKVFGLEEIFIEKIEKKYKEVYSTVIKLSKVINLQFSIFLYINILSTCLIFFLSYLQVSNNILTIGELISIVSIYVLFLSQLKNLLELQPKIQLAVSAQKRLYEYYIAEGKKFIKNRNRQTFLGDINIKNLNYSIFSKKVLCNINLEIKSGEKIVLTGKSGSGKTTLAKLISGLLSSENDEIYYQGLTINECGIEFIHENILYVSANSFVFEGSIRDNITLFSKFQHSDERIFEILDCVGLASKVNGLIEKLDHYITDDNLSFSTGEVQKLSIARAILSGKNFIIFDETTSNIDFESENKIIKYLLNQKDKTIVFITHKESLISMINNRIVLENGHLMKSTS